ncbi:MAG: hypothetical protein A2X42_09165 [Candidatus Margulisbacteria bacterium GWF2_38_17]|nr:MAG: hypothetical protein A2X43_10345 [Candidatus Margulisbacteria bacterium GWD2_39_127]OGI05421.1 MAG: hypothetical protein A2X42_09165 [Candidatus Margulisbacteria bacterium GWF2_38_17]OGI07841.1 MAG: hypothetical protein A2X41_11990 [Candidatus Margulisbacteria bacterium GWE2_39_32]
MKKVAIIAPDALPVPPIRGGGIENGIWEILPHLKKFEVHVLSIYEPEIDKLSSYEKEGQHHIHRFYLSDRKKALLRLRHLSFNFHFPYAFATAKKLNELKPDIIHIRSRLWLLPYYKKLLTFKPKIILHHHNHYFCNMKDKSVKKYLDMIDAFVGVSHYTSSLEVINRFPEYQNKCFDIHNGITLEKFHLSPQQKNKDLLQKLGLKATDTTMIFVGRLTHSKGVHTILLAMKELVPQYPDLKLLIIGSSWFGENKEDTYSTYLKELSLSIKNNVIFTGFINRNEIESYYHVADLFVAPSIFQDPSPNTCYEASAVGLPIVASTRGGIPEIVEDGKTGILMKTAENYQELKEKITYFLTNREVMEMMGKAARKRMENVFTWKCAAEKTEKLYSYLLDS